MQTSHVKIAPDLYLIRTDTTPTNKAPAQPVKAPPTNHVVVIDCSGSMYNDLPLIRDQLKQKLPKILGEKDTISIVWFSGRGQFGTLIEAEPVASLADLADINRAIDRWLKPVGLTGFKEPIEEVVRLVDRVKKKRPDGVFSLFFMSDGHDNQWNRADILSAIERAAGGLAASTFVEYGYYADRVLLAAMAERAGGTLIFAQTFDTYVPVLEASLSKRPSGAKRIVVKIEGAPLGGFAWAIRDGDLITYAVEKGEAHVPEDSAIVWYLASTPVGTLNVADGERPPNTFSSAAYAAISLFSVRMRPDIILPILKALGDVKFIDDFSKCFGKQRYSTFMDDAKAAVFDPSKRLTKGFDPSKVPADDAYTLFDLLKALSDDDDNRVLLDHPSFTYNRVSRARLDASEVLTADEQAQVDEITKQISQAGKNAAKVKELRGKLDAILDGKQGLKFKANPAPDGYSINSLVFNEDRPNISIGIRQDGIVDISSKLPDNLKTEGKIPNLFPTFRFRNYAIVSDGIVNVAKLPVRLTRKTADALFAVLPEGAKPEEVKIADDHVVCVLNLNELPVINRKMVQTVSARDLAQKQFELERARAAQKVYKAYRDERVAKKESASFKALYGDQGAEWLKEQGFTDYSGFSPKMVQADSTDFYMGKELSVKIAGYSALPTVKAVKERRAEISGGGGKKAKTYTPTMALMAPYIEECEAELAKGIADADFITWIDAKAKDATRRARDMIREAAQTKFSIIVGQTWFTEFPTIDDNEIDLAVDGSTVACKMEMKEVEIKI